MIFGFLAGLLFYCATALPFAAISGVNGDAWAAIFMLYGVVCGGVGVTSGTRR